MSKFRYRKERHSVTLLYAHLVFVVKYRRKVLTKDVRDRCSDIFREVGNKMDFQVLEVNGHEDHIHLLIEYPPKYSISKLVNHLKGVSSRYLRKEFELNPHQEHLWSPSYFAVSCEGAPINKIKEYIENQNNE